MKKTWTWKGLWQLFKQSFKGFSEHKITKLSGSLAYATVFSMAPLLIVIIFLCSIFLGQEAVRGNIYSGLESFLGKDTAMQLQDIIKNASLSGKTNLAAIVGIVTLLIGSTAIFGEIQDSINSIWGLKPKPKKGWLKILQNRFLSFSIIIGLGFLLLVSLALTALIDVFSKYLLTTYPDLAVVLLYVLNQVITLLVATIIFAIIFKVLPDARIKWRDVIAGAILTAFLFMVGKFLISFYISRTAVGSTYGAAGSLVILLLWTYYSAIILYFGAEFTKRYAIRYGESIHPNDYAVTVKEVVIETGKETIQEKEKNIPAHKTKP